MEREHAAQRCCAHAKESQVKPLLRRWSTALTPREFTLFTIPLAQT
jgi:hypothetical protein